VGGLIKALRGNALKLKPHAPDEVKNGFREWQKINAEYANQWEDADKNRTGKPNKAAQKFIDLYNQYGYLLTKKQNNHLILDTKRITV
jgi:hypothetical protein